MPIPGGKYGDIAEHCGWAVGRCEAVLGRRQEKMAMDRSQCTE